MSAHLSKCHIVGNHMSGINYAFHTCNRYVGTVFKQIALTNTYIVSFVHMDRSRTFRLWGGGGGVLTFYSHQKRGRTNAPQKVIGHKGGIHLLLKGCGSIPVFLRKPRATCDFQAGVRSPGLWLPSGSAHGASPFPNIELIWYFILTE